MGSEITSIPGFLTSFYAILCGSIVEIFWLARRWYVRRNGRPRNSNYANKAHRISSGWFFGLFFPGVLSANLLSERWAVPLIVLLLVSFSGYACWSVYVWKQASSNPDDYRYELFVQGGLVILMLGIVIILPMLT